MKIKRQGSIALYWIIGVLLTSISVVVMNSSFEMLNNAKSNYMKEAKYFSSGEINKILTRCKNETSGTSFSYSYNLDFNYGEEIAISATCDKNAENSSAKYTLISCFKDFPGSPNTICKEYRGTGDLTNSWI